MITVTAARDGRGVAWVVAPCGCAQKLLDMHDQAKLNAFMTHVVDQTPCETERNDASSIERDE